MLGAAVAALAGCGDGGPHLRDRDAAGLLTLAHRIPHEGPCAQARDIAALRARARALVVARRVPAALQQSLASGVDALVAETPTCLPPVETAAPAPEQTPVAAPSRGRGDGHKHGHGHHGHGHGKGD